MSAQAAELLPRAGGGTAPAGLIPDWKTRRVLLVLPVAEMKAYAPFVPELEHFYAGFLRELARYEDVACVVPDAARAERMMRLSGLGAEAFPLARLPDIRVRDFAPLCAHGRFVAFGRASRAGSPGADEGGPAALRRLLAERGVRVRCTPLALGGGRLVHNGAGVGVASRAGVGGDCGPAVSEHLRRALGLERLVLVPPAAGDRFEPIDWTLRFVSPRLLLVSDSAWLPGGAEFQQRLDGILDARLPRLTRVTLPRRLPEAPLGSGPHACGSYTSFLHTAQRLYVPLYDAPEDREIELTFDCLFPGRVSYVPARAIARHGGSLSSIAWSHV